MTAPASPAADTAPAVNLNPDLDIVMTDADGKLIISDGRSTVALTGPMREQFRAQLDRYYTPASRYTAFLAGFLFAARVEFKRDKSEPKGE